MNYFSVYRSGNHLQINDSWENISYLEKVTLQWEKSTNFQFPRMYSARLTYPKSPVFFFFYNNGDYETTIEVFHEMDPETRKVGISLRVHCDVPPTFLELYVFGFPDYVPEPRSGLAVYNQNGRLIFSSDQKYLNIIGTEKNANLEGKVKEFPPHQKVAVGISSIYVNHAFEGEMISETAYDVTLLPKNRGVKITPMESAFWVGDIGEEPGSEWSWGGDSMLTFADVTNF